MKLRVRSDRTWPRTRRARPIQEQTEDRDQDNRSRPEQRRQQDQKQQHWKGEQRIDRPHQNGVRKPPAGGGGEPDEESNNERDGDAEGGDGERDPAALEQPPQDVTTEAVAAQPQKSSGLCRDLVRRD